MHMPRGPAQDKCPAFIESAAIGQDAPSTDDLPEAAHARNHAMSIQLSSERRCTRVGQPQNSAGGWGCRV
eukprot:1137431-Pelagomonas_calceolata.AAC.2